MRKSKLTIFAAAMAAFALAASAAAPPASAANIFQKGGGAFHGGHAGWSQGGGWAHGGGWGGHRRYGGWGGYGYGLGLGLLGGALAGSMIASPYYGYYGDDSCLTYQPVYNRWGYVIGQRPVYVC
jgi:hypothetical protein